MTRRIRISLAIGLTLLFGLGLNGCAYRLRGKVVQGAAPGIELVHHTDARLKGPGIVNAEVLLTRDPQTPNRYRAGSDRTSGSGEFGVGLNDFGSGWMEEQWLIQTTKTGYQNTEMTMALPRDSRKWRLLITMTQGAATPIGTEMDEIMEDVEQFK